MLLDWKTLVNNSVKVLDGQVQNDNFYLLANFLALEKVDNLVGLSLMEQIYDSTLLVNKINHHIYAKEFSGANMWLCLVDKINHYILTKEFVDFYISTFIKSKFLVAVMRTKERLCEPTSLQTCIG